MKREGFVFYQSFLRAGENLPEKEQLLYYQRLLKYGVDGQDIDSGNGVVEAMFHLVKPQLDANNKKYQNGTKGGRPKTKIKPNNNQNETIIEPKENDNDNNNVNDNVNEEKEKFLENLTIFIKNKPGRERLYSKDILNSFYLYRTEPIVKGKGKGHIKQYEQKTRSLEPRLDRFLEGTLGSGETPRLLKKKYGIS